MIRGTEAPRHGGTGAFARALLLCVGASVLPCVALAQCPDGTPPPCSRPARASAAPPRGSIAVLPFANRSADSADAYLAEELPEQISGRLSRIAQLHVTSATAVAAQWRRTPDALAAARALRVEWLVTGSLRRVGRQVSANIELGRTASGEQAWASPFRSGEGDLAAIEVQVAESVAVAVGGRLAPAQVAVLQRSASRNPEAYRLYLYARSLMARRTQNDIQSALRAVQEAVRLDPGFAAAWARLSIARGLQTQYGNPDGLSRDSLMTLSRAAADRAIRLDSSVAEGWLALGQLNAVATDFGGSWRALSRAVRLDSLDGDIEHALGYLYGIETLALPEQAERHFRRALELNPDLRNSWRHLGLTFWARGRLPEALACLDSALARGQWTVGLIDRAWLRFEKGDLAGALADQAAADALGQAPASLAALVPLAVRRPIYGLAQGDSASALAMMDGPGDTGPHLIARALIAMVLGRREVALTTLEQLRALPDPREPPCALGIPCSASLRTWRTLHIGLFAPVHGDARFQRLLAETRPRVPWLDAEHTR